jgi:hypothetical protein
LIVAIPQKEFFVRDVTLSQPVILSYLVPQAIRRPDTFIGHGRPGKVLAKIDADGQANHRPPRSG